MLTRKRLPSRSFSHFTEDLQSRGRYTFCKQEAISALNISENAFHKSVGRLVLEKRLIRIVNEFYAIIPFEYKNSGGMPATHYIDSLMKFEQQPYYVGVLSAAALHGAAHQSPQELQIITSKPLSLIKAGRSRIRFLIKGKVLETPIQAMKTPSGYIQVSTPEATSFDLFRYPKAASGLSNIATVLKELSEAMDAEKLAKLASVTESSYVQRLGYLLDLAGAKKLTPPLIACLKKHHRWDYISLRPGRKSGSDTRDPKWRLIINDTVESDV